MPAVHVTVNNFVSELFAEIRAQFPDPNQPLTFEGTGRIMLAFNRVGQKHRATIADQSRPELGRDPWREMRGTNRV